MVLRTVTSLEVLKIILLRRSAVYANKISCIHSKFPNKSCVSIHTGISQNSNGLVTFFNGKHQLKSKLANFMMSYAV